ncbi:hypothetical protein F01_421162 [Burkholderia cenocepacia]|nr:hypothetical protein F01_421162 [Burkholderia cenocepacia]
MRPHARFLVAARHRRDVAILAIDTAEIGQARRRRRPYLGCRALRGRLESRIDRHAVLVDPALRHHFLARQMTLQRRRDLAGMQRIRADTERRAEHVELHREQRVGRFRLPVRQPFVVPAREIDIVPADRRQPVPERRHRDHARAVAVRDRRPQPVDERVVTEVIDGQLRFPSVAQASLRARHDARAVDDDVHVAPRVDEPRGECGHARGVREIERRDFHAVDVARRLARGRDAPCADDDVRTGLRQRPRGFEAETRMAARDDGGLAVQVEAGQDVARRRGGVESGMKGMLPARHRRLQEQGAKLEAAHRPRHCTNPFSGRASGL